MRRFARAFFAIAAGGVCLVGAFADAAGADDGLEPPNWSEIDLNDDDFLQHSPWVDQWGSRHNLGAVEEEWERLDEDQQDDLRAWVQEMRGEYSDPEVREWAETHLDDYPEGALRVELGIPGRGAEEWAGDLVDTATDIPEGVADTVTGFPGNVADSAFESLANAVGSGAGSLTGWVGQELAATGTPAELEADWYQEHYRRMLGWAGLLMVPFAMVAIGAAVLRGETSRIGETLLEIPVAYLLGVAAIGLVSAAAGLSMAMANSLASGVAEDSETLAMNVTAILTVREAMNPGTVFLLGLVIALAALATAVWLLLTEAAVYAVVLFAPLAFAGRVWPGSAAAGWGRKLLTMALALVGAKVVIFALWALAVRGLAEGTGEFWQAAGEVQGTQGGLRSALALAALLVMTAFSPPAVLRLVAMAEGSEAAPSPGRAAGQGLSVVHQGSSAVRAMGGLSRGARLPVSNGSGGGGGDSPSGKGPSTPGPTPQAESRAGGASKPAGDGRDASGGGERAGSESSAPRGGSSRANEAGSVGRPQAAGEAGGGSSGGGVGRQAPPASPPGTGDGKLWPKR